MIDSYLEYAPFIIGPIVLIWGLIWIMGAKKFAREFKVLERVAYYKRPKYYKMKVNSLYFLIMVSGWGGLTASWMYFFVTAYVIGFMTSEKCGIKENRLLALVTIGVSIVQMSYQTYLLCI